jgi:hypothetical protein
VPLASVYFNLRKRTSVFNSFALYNLTRHNNNYANKARPEPRYSVKLFEETIADELA